MLVTIACFLLFLGVLVALVAAREAKKELGQRIPPAQAKVAARILLVGGLGLLGYSLYLRAVA